MRISYFIVITLFSFFTAAQVLATEDIPNATDVPEIGRYPGSFIKSYKKGDYESFLYPVQALNYSKKGGVDEYQASIERTEGERTTIVYEVPTEVTSSLLRVVRSIEAGLASKGFDMIFSCGGEANGCGRNFTHYTFANGFPYSKFVGRQTGDPYKYVYVGSLGIGSERYVAFIMVAKDGSKAVNYSVDVVKEIDLELEELVLTVDEMTEQINSRGMVTLGGLYFDHNEATLTDQSQPALEVIKEYLSVNEGADYLVVGHTDSSGGFSYNLNLSENRAKSVITALESLLGDEPSTSLTAFGAAYAAPVGSNSTEDGRANNRRVELVLVDSGNG